MMTWSARRRDLVSATRLAGRLLALSTLLLVAAIAWLLFRPPAATPVVSLATDLLAGQATGLAAATDGSLALTDALPAAAIEAPYTRAGILIGPLMPLARPATGVEARWQGEAGAGALVRLEARGQTGERYTEWVEAPADGGVAALPWPVDALQYRLTLLAEADAPGPVVRSVALAPAAAPVATEVTASATPATYRVYATRIGLVGATTANGHVIRPEDQFVALPSSSALSQRGGHEYQVRVTYQGRSLTLPVWDVGPWNVRDNYWASAIRREMWNDLPTGLPQAAAAHRDAYNGGRDGFGRRVTSPAGVDISDGAWAALGMPDSDWVSVTFLWTGAPE